MPTRWQKLPLDINKVTADVIVVGGGGAASRAALSAHQAGAMVRLVTKVPLRSGGSTVHGASEAMSMSAAGFGDRSDSAEVHFQDTMQAGRGFIDRTLVRVLAEEAPARLKDLIQLGVVLDGEVGKPKLIRNDYNSYARAVSVRGRTGKVFVDALCNELLRLGVVIDANVALVDLVRDRDGTVAGALGYDSKRRVLVHYESPCVILGTGGIQGAFEQQVSTAEMTGDGQAICFRHGAEMVNLEFHQFGPALIYPYAQIFSASCFRLQPKLLNVNGNEFLRSYVPPHVDLNTVYGEKGFRFTTSNASRYIDIAIAGEINAGRGTSRGGIYFSFAHVPQDKFDALMPNTVRWMREHGLDPGRDKLEVAIAFQGMNGGVCMTGTDAQSTIPGLFVIGELAGGVRGPDRPGGNSLAEGQVFGHRSGCAAAARAARHKPGEAYTLDATIDFLSHAMRKEEPDASISELAYEIRRTMQRNCLVEKTAQRLNAALDSVMKAKHELDHNLAITPENLIEGLGVRNLAQVSELVLRACLNRKETRSGHYRLDYPARDDQHYMQAFLLKRDGDGVCFTACQY